MAFSFAYPPATFIFAQGASLNLLPIFTPGGSAPPTPTVFSLPAPLPINIALDSATGRIFGDAIFLSQCPPTIFTVDASYATAITDASFSLAIYVPPTFIYSPSSQILTQNQSVTIIPFYISISTTSTTYNLQSPASLPTGLSLNSINGVISGTPSTIIPSAEYVIRATRGTFTYDTSLNLAVFTVPIFTYPLTNYQLIQNTPVTNIKPILTDPNNPINSFAIEGCPLPFGLALNPTTGEIVGTPTVLTTTREYTITAINQVASYNVKLLLSVIRTPLAPPVVSTNGPCLTDPAIAMRRKAEILKYKRNQADLTKNQYFAMAVQGRGPYAKKIWANQSDTATNPNINNLIQQNNSLICGSTNPIQCSLTSASDVPGPEQVLCLDPSVPLIGYTAPNTTKINIGHKWPQTAWKAGDAGFPPSKSGTDDI